jgi:uncharacterized protein
MRVPGNGSPNKNPRSLRVLYNCSKCPAYCCSYEQIEITKRDLRRIARHFGISYEEAERRYTKNSPVGRVLRHKKDDIFQTVCVFLDGEDRRCTIYDARPSVCQSYPDSLRCGYYDFLASERRRQDDPDLIPSA